MPYIIAVTGGIGSGKSVVSKILRAEGYNVYDSDYEAKRIMDVNTDIHCQLCERIHVDAVKDGIINRQLISSIVFSNLEKLAVLNDIVHTAVRRHFSHWIKSLENCSLLFVETAILYQSHVDKMVNEEWIVEAPIELRIARVMKRNSMTSNEVLFRIKSQDVFTPESTLQSVKRIINDEKVALLPQVKRLISQQTVKSIF